MVVKEKKKLALRDRLREQNYQTHEVLMFNEYFLLSRGIGLPRSAAASNISEGN